MTNNSFTPYNSAHSYQATQYFPQPQGNVYMINNSLEVANIPMSAGLSVALCPSEEFMYLKAMQNGTPTICAYKIKPFDQPQQQAQSQDATPLMEKLSKLTQRLTTIEKTLQELKNTGGNLNELL